MAMSFFKNVVLTLIILCSLSGCGDLFENKVIPRSLEADQFKANCDLDVNQFSEIMYTNIKSQFLCLGENLNLFIRVVKTDRRGYMNRGALEAYIKNNLPDTKPEVIKALKAVYDLNYLITGDDREYISAVNVDKVINFAIKFNIEAALNYQAIFEDKDKISYNVHVTQRSRISDSNKRLVSELMMLFNRDTVGNPRKINVISLLENFSVNPERFKQLLFAKTILVGGNETEVTSQELNLLLLNFDKLVLMVMDAVKYKYIDFGQADILKLISQNVDAFSAIYLNDSLGNRDDVEFSTLTKLKQAVTTFITVKDFNINDYGKILEEAKNVIMGGDREKIKGRDIRNLITHAQDVLKKGTVFHSIWNQFHDALEGPLPVNINFAEYRHVYPKNVEALEHFERIVKKYRFMKGKNKSPYYLKKYARNPDAIAEIYMYEYIIKLFFKTHGSPSSSVGGYSIDIDGVTKIIKNINEDLVKNGLLLPEREESVSETIALLSILFQFQSDNNNMLDVNEGAEFAVALITSWEMSGKVFKYIESKCDKKDNFQRISPECFKQNFFQGMCKDYYSYYPLLFESLGAKTCEEVLNTTDNLAFLDVSIRSARSCHIYDKVSKEEIYYTRGDTFTILVALMHVETTILRWDSAYAKKPGNNNNIMDPFEVENAYEIYSGALEVLLKTKPAVVKKFQKQIYQYLIKYEEIPATNNIPNTWKFARFLLTPNKSATANRKTVASILYNISEEKTKNAIAAGNPEYDCSVLKDPNNIPGGPKPRNQAPAVPVVAAPVEDFSYILEPIKLGKDGAFYLEKESCFTLFNSRFCL